MLYIHFIRLSNNLNSLLLFNVSFYCWLLPFLGSYRAPQILHTARQNGNSINSIDDEFRYCIQFTHWIHFYFLDWKTSNGKVCYWRCDKMFAHIHIGSVTKMNGDEEFPPNVMYRNDSCYGDNAHLHNHWVNGISFLIALFNIP